MTRSEALEKLAESLKTLTEDGVVTWYRYPGGKVSGAFIKLFLHLDEPDEENGPHTLAILSDGQESFPTPVSADGEPEEISGPIVTALFKEVERQFPSVH